MLRITEKNFINKKWAVSTCIPCALPKKILSQIDSVSNQAALACHAMKA
jgi:hypothetical protein